MNGKYGMLSGIGVAGYVGFREESIREDKLIVLQGKRRSMFRSNLGYQDYIEISRDSVEVRCYLPRFMSNHLSSAHFKPLRKSICGSKSEYRSISLQ
jgi:hypothetical protein